MGGNLTIISAWHDGQTIRYTLSNNTVRSSAVGSHLEFLGFTATSITYADGHSIKVMLLDTTNGGMSNGRTVGTRR